MPPPAFRDPTAFATIRKIDVSQSTILTDWENFSRKENFAGGKGSIHGLRNVQVLWIVAGVRSRDGSVGASQNRTAFEG